MQRAVGFFDRLPSEIIISLFNHFEITTTTTTAAMMMMRWCDAMMIRLMVRCDRWFWNPFDDTVRRWSDAFDDTIRWWWNAIDGAMRSMMRWWFDEMMVGCDAIGWYVANDDGAMRSMMIQSDDSGMCSMIWSMMWCDRWRFDDGAMRANYTMQSTKRWWFDDDARRSMMVEYVTIIVRWYDRSMIRCVDGSMIRCDRWWWNAMCSMRSMMVECDRWYDPTVDDDGAMATIRTIDDDDTMVRSMIDKPIDGAIDDDDTIDGAMRWWWYDRWCDAIDDDALMIRCERWWCNAMMIRIDDGGMR